MSGLSRSDTRNLMDRHDLGPSRALGQNFLCDQGMVDKIVRLSAVNGDSNVVEIGPGLGSLTLALCETGARVIAIEIDRYLLPALRERVGDHEAGGRLSIVNQDVREVSWPDLLGSDTWTVVANLPYNIATPLILDLLAQQPKLDRWLVMVQREAGERLVAGPGSRVYGIPSVLLAFWAEARLVGSVPAELFFPRPKVESVLVEIVRHRPVTEPPVAFGSFAQVVRTGFNQRRKMLRRSLSGLAEPSAFVAAGVEPTARPEQLGLAEWIRLAAAIDHEVWAP